METATRKLSDHSNSTTYLAATIEMIQSLSGHSSETGRVSLSPRQQPASPAMLSTSSDSTLPTPPTSNRPSSESMEKKRTLQVTTTTALEPVEHSSSSNRADMVSGIPYLSVDTLPPKRFSDVVISTSRVFSNDDLSPVIRRVTAHDVLASDTDTESLNAYVDGFPKKSTAAAFFAKLRTTASAPTTPRDGTEAVEEKHRGKHGIPLRESLRDDPHVSRLNLNLL